MVRLPGLGVSTFAVVTVLACADQPLGPPPGRTPSPDVIVSNARSASSGAGDASGAGSWDYSIAVRAGGGPFVFVSMAPGSFAGADAVTIRNLTSPEPDSLVVPLANGGFDPVPLRANEDDELELESRGTVSLQKYARVPRRRPPTVVRVSPPEGRTDVALYVRPTIVLSEPLDPASLGGAVRLTTQGAEVPGQVVIQTGAPWTVEFVPEHPLAPSATYELTVSPDLRDTDGDNLAAEVSVAFTTAAVAPGPAGGPTGTERIAFVSTRSGGPWIYLANADGSGVVPLTGGADPAWSWDGSMIAFTYGGVIRAINANGSGNRLIAGGQHPAWSPNGRIVFVTGAGLTVANADGSGARLLLRHTFKNPDSQDVVAWPTWSPDGRRIAFVFIECCWEQPWQVYVVNEDGSGLRVLTEGRQGFDPAWSPDGSRIAFSSFYFDQIDGSTGASVSSIDISGTGGLTHHVRGLATEWNFVGQPDWSPDGGQIAFSSAIGSTAEGAPPMRLHVVDIETGVTRQLIPDAIAPTQAAYQDSDVAWSRAAP